MIFTNLPDLTHAVQKCICEYNGCAFLTQLSLFSTYYGNITSFPFLSKQTNKAKTATTKQTNNKQKMRNLFIGNIIFSIFWKMSDF